MYVLRQNAAPLRGARFGNPLKIFKVCRAYRALIMITYIMQCPAVYVVMPSVRNAPEGQFKFTKFSLDKYKFANHV